MRTGGSIFPTDILKTAGFHDTTKVLICVRVMIDTIQVFTDDTLVSRMSISMIIIRDIV